MTSERGKLGVDRVLCEGRAGIRDFEANTLLVTGWGGLLGVGKRASHLSGRQCLLAARLRLAVPESGFSRPSPPLCALLMRRSCLSVCASWDSVCFFG